MIEIRGRDGPQVVVLAETDPSATVLGRGLGLCTRDRTVSRHHLTLYFDPHHPDSLAFEVNGKNPLWVLSRKTGTVRVYRTSDKGLVGVGDGFCFSGNEPFWFFLEEGRSRAAQASATVGEEFDKERESEVDDRLEMDVSAIDPVKEFGFLPAGHEFDSYPKHMLREVKDWDWFLAEPSKERDDSEDESDEAIARSGRRRERRIRKAKDDAMEEDEWTGESEEDEEALRKASKAKKSLYLTRSRDLVKLTKKVGSSGVSSSMKKKKADHVEDEDEEDEEEDDETLGGFIIDDDDAEQEEDSEDRNEEEFVDDIEDD